MTPQQQVVARLLEKFPRAGSLTLSRMAYKESPELFTTPDAARSAVRRARGAMGKQHRKWQADKSHRRPPQQPGDPFSKIPDGNTYFDSWQALQVDGPLRVLVLSDIHIPFHDKPALLTALQWGKNAEVDTVLLNGDVADFFSVSFWEKDPRKRQLKKEIETTRAFYQALREGFPEARIITKLGNHEERWIRYLSVKAPELLGVEDFDIESVLRLKKWRVESVAEKRPIRLGQLNVIHGHEYRFSISNPVNPARGVFLRCKAYALCGHFHQGSHHSDRTVEQKTVATWSTGCLCDLHPDYAPLNNWNHGFAFVEVDASGKFQVKNCFISNGKVY